MTEPTVHEGRTFDRLIEFDERSRQFPIRALVGDQPRQSRLWPVSHVLDQGSEGACVGFACTHEAIADPFPHGDLDNEYARAIYHEAQKIDEWEGENYSGTSVIAGLKVMAARGLITEYRWAFDIDDLVLALGHAGPAVLGIPWRDSMMGSDFAGLLDISGTNVGGHAILAMGVLVDEAIPGHDVEDYVVLWNSWGNDWPHQGYGGRAFIRASDLAELLDDAGEAAIPLVRT